MTENNVLIEKFQGYDIYYVKTENAFIADDDEHNLHFRAMSLFQLQCDIKSSKKTPMDKEAFLKTGYFGLEISRVKILSINKATKRFSYKILACTDSQYDVGKVKEDEDLDKFYDSNIANQALFNQVRELQVEIEKVEAKQQGLVRRLK